MASRVVETVFGVAESITPGEIKVRSGFPCRYLSDDLIDPFLAINELGRAAGVAAEVTNRTTGTSRWTPLIGYDIVTYVRRGRCSWRDCCGSRGVIDAGGVQWAQTNCGTIRDEEFTESPGVPEEERALHAFQFWLAVPELVDPAAACYWEAPNATMNWFSVTPQMDIKVIFGDLSEPTALRCAPFFREGQRSDVVLADIVLKPPAFRAAVPSHRAPAFTVTREVIPLSVELSTCMMYVYEGAGRVYGGLSDEAGTIVERGDLVFFRPVADESSVDPDTKPPVVVSATSEVVGLKFILLAGRRVGRPICRYANFIGNTEQDLQEALDRYGQGRLVTQKPQRKMY